MIFVLSRLCDHPVSEGAGHSLSVDLRSMRTRRVKRELLVTTSGQQAAAAGAVTDSDAARVGNTTSSTLSPALASGHANETLGGALSNVVHEQVVFCNDPGTGLRAIIAIYSTQLGPALGGTRFYPYRSDEAAVTDVLNLSRAMTYKSALAGLDLGGGKAVIIGDPGALKSEALLRAYGRFVQSLGGRYVTACDIGTDSEDMDIIARECSYVAGRTEPHGGAGDSSVLTAFGVFEGMRAAAEHVWGSPSLDGRTVAVEGVGKVGSHLVDHLLSDGAKVMVYDVSATAVQRVVSRHPQVVAVSKRDDLVGGDLDVYAPCALGGALDDETVASLRAKIVCGGANNQLAHPGIEEQLLQRGILYAPDYVVNAGGLIQVADELEGFSFERAKLRTEQIFATTKQIFAIADKDSVAPGVAADRLAERRMSEIGRLRAIWLPR
jgi:valine dehydrogenase (NAD+)